MNRFVNKATSKIQNTGGRVSSDHIAEPSEHKTHKFDLQVKHIKDTETLGTQEIRMFLQILSGYSSDDRPRFYAEYEKVMSTRFSEVIEVLHFKDVIHITSIYHQFAKTVRPQSFNDARQKYLSLHVLEPLLSKLKKIKLNSQDLELIYVRNPNNVLFITQHAHTQSAYAPGKIIFTQAKSLLEKGKNVRVISLGSIDDSFKTLMESNANFNVRRTKSEDGEKIFHELRDELNEFKPVAIFTEIEVSILVAIEIWKLPSPIFLVSGGFYRVPWHSGILLTKELKRQIGSSTTVQKIFSVPQTHIPESLAPYCDPMLLAEEKAKLNITDEFVIATFARFEKISDEFLHTVCAILEKIPNSIIILAGPGDKRCAKDILDHLIATDRVKLLGDSDISILGYCCDVFLETFPQCVGFAALESMAKGKPVFSLDSQLLDFYRVNRVERLIFESQEQLIKSLSNAANDKNFYDEISIESIEFIEKHFYDLSKLSDALLAVIDKHDQTR
ncbi:hypothetical protein N9X05_18530 [Paracoccaceae bacterium]|nr:hypothetical protein [Paracoccaceae bacterium]